MWGPKLGDGAHLKGCEKWVQRGCEDFRRGCKKKTFFTIMFLTEVAAAGPLF